jgi:hypothetical protein
MFAEDPPVFCFDYVPEYFHEFIYLFALATAQKSKKCGFDRGNTNLWDDPDITLQDIPVI